MIRKTVTVPKAAEVPRFQQILRRTDQDNDGRVTRKEFKAAMRKLGCQNESQWNFRLIQRFFNEIEPRGVPGTVSITRLTQYVKNLVDYSMSTELDDAKKSKGQTIKASYTTNTGYNGGGGGEGSDDDGEDDEIFNRRKLIADQKLFKKISIALQDIIGDAKADYGSTLEEAIRTTIRRYFIKSDPRSIGLVSEEKFMVFMRKSGLHDELTAGEMQKLFDKLKRVGSANMIDYEK